MDIIDIIIAKKLFGGGGFPLGEPTGEYKFNDLGITWESTAEVNV